MKVAELLESRLQNWRELEQLCLQLEHHRKQRAGAPSVARFATLYRAACADLALADAYQLPPNTVQYLHQLVGRAHNQLYLSRKFAYKRWLYEMIHLVPQRLFHDNCVRLAFFMFYGVFVASMIAAHLNPAFADRVVGKEMLQQVEEMHADSISGTGFNEAQAGSAFYLTHNGTIGLRCFVFGILLGVGGIYETIFNAMILGTMFGHMIDAPEPSSSNFFQFVTAHGPFELTAIVLGAAAGMKLGFSIIFTQGYTRTASVRRAFREAIPSAVTAVILFGLAGVIEASLSPSTAPYALKAGVSVMSCAILVFYFVGLGYPRGEQSHAV
jgi:uncharacterized membrane protein SpoIIM required for sporulation